MRTDWTYEELIEIFDYDQESGIVLWKRRNPKTIYHGESWNQRYAGKPAGFRDSLGYLVLAWSHRGKKYSCQGARILFALGSKIGTADLPPVVDHKDGNPYNDRFSNLRAASSANNNHNESLKRNNTTGYKWVSIDNRPYSRGFRAAVRALQPDGTVKNFDRTFHTAEQAFEAALEWAKKHHADFICDGIRKEVE